MSPRLLQRGQLLVAGVVLIVIVALMISALGFLYVSNQSSSALHDSSAAAYYAARSGIEVATRQFVNGTACAALAVGPPGPQPAVGSNASFRTVATSYNVSPPTANNTTVNAIQAFIPIGAGVIGNYAPSGRVRIQTEEIDYSAQSSDSTVCGGSPPCLVVSKRGAAGTTAAAHATQPVYQNLCHIRSTGTSGRATRIVDRALHDALAMMAYSKIGTGVTAAQQSTPYYQLWDGAAWGGELAANVPGTTSSIHSIALRMARTRNEALMATVGANGNIRLQIWDGFAWTFATGAGVGANGLLATMPAATPQSRGVDIAYERANDSAIIVYNNNTRNPQYRVWDGSTLSAAGSITVGAGGNYPTAQPPQWIKLAASPLAASNEIVLMTLDSARDTSGAWWNGTAWASMEAGVATVWDVNVSNNNTCTDPFTPGGTTCEAIAVEYEQNSGRAIFIWATSAATTNSFRVWNSTATPISAINTLTIAASGGVGQWVQLVAQPGSNNMLFGVEDAASDLNTRFWNGAAWDAPARHPEHDGTVERDANNFPSNRSFSLAFETHPLQVGKGWLFWGDGATVSRKQWDPALSGACTGGTGTCWGGVTTVGDDTMRVETLAHPGSGAVFAMFYEQVGAGTPEQILETHSLNGTATWTLNAAGVNPAGAYVVWAGRNDTDSNTSRRQTLAARRQINIITQEFFFSP